MLKVAQVPDLPEFKQDELSSKALRTRRHFPTFLNSLYTMLEEDKYSDIICWDKEGFGFFLKNAKSFALKVLPQYFQSPNYASFQRQLNLYDFQRRREEIGVSYSHAFFLKCSKNLMFKMKRRKNKKLDKLRELEEKTEVVVVSSFSKGTTKEELKSVENEDDEMEDEVAQILVEKIEEIKQSQQRLENRMKVERALNDLFEARLKIEKLDFKEMENQGQLVPKMLRVIVKVLEEIENNLSPNNSPREITKKSTITPKCQQSPTYSMYQSWSYPIPNLKQAIKQGMKIYTESISQLGNSTLKEFKEWMGNFLNEKGMNYNNIERILSSLFSIYNTPQVADAKVWNVITENAESLVSVTTSIFEEAARRLYISNSTKVKEEGSDEEKDMSFGLGEEVPMNMRSGSDLEISDNDGTESEREMDICPMFNRIPSLISENSTVISQAS